MKGTMRAALAGALILSGAGCFGYRGPSGVEDSLERTLGVELKRDSGVKLGYLSAQFAASFISSDGHDDNDLNFHDLTSIGIAVFERGAANGRTPRRLEPSDLGLEGYSTMVRACDGDDQVLLLVKPANGKIHEMVLLTVDADEVMVAHLTGRLDKFIEKAIAETNRDGAAGARAVLGRQEAL